MNPAAMSLLPPKPTAGSGQRAIKQAPFVELFDGRVQGVVSSGSDVQRVYVAFFEAGVFDYYCSTNNNRPCGGLHGRPCKHLQTLLQEALLQYGAEQVTRFLQAPVEASQVKKAQDLLAHMRGGALKKEPTGPFRRSSNFNIRIENLVDTG
jgi:hypothetical protein